MKQLITKYRRKELSSFTLLEMLVVLIIIGVLILLFIPNIANQRENINNTEKDTIEKVVETQSQLYLLDNPDKTSVEPEDLVDKYLEEKQLEAYRKHFPKP
ncbi:competence type IV pilus major pilin ComGC [Enterococcus nangangensis]|uniref:competence type IV pilus major pilin ComGC n=1 Tax=Enterococcus nangangensis TaxID=2559926 RepID=UPI0010F77BB0|nr:competence type IV pilus major pilin ComGC [Enterococcus nangangensis]